MSDQDAGAESGDATPLSPDERAMFVEGVLDLAREGRTAELLEMIEAGVSVNLSNARGDTPLILAAYREHLGTVEALLAVGADTDMVNSMGQTALAAAIFRNNAPIVTALLDAGADTSSGTNPAMAIAQQFGLTQMQQLLEAHSSGS